MHQKNYTYTSKLSIYFSCKPMLSFFKRNVCVWGVKCIEHKIGKGWSDLLIKSIAEKWKNVAINCYKSHLIYRHLFVVREFVVVSHLKIFPLQLLGPAEKPMASPSSSKGKILRWDTFQIIGGKFNCLIQAVVILAYDKIYFWACGQLIL